MRIHFTLTERIRDNIIQDCMIPPTYIVRTRNESARTVGFMRDLIKWRIDFSPITYGIPTIDVGLVMERSFELLTRESC